MDFIRRIKEEIFMKKIILLLTFLTLFLFSSFSIDNTSDIKKNHNIYFYFKQKFTYEGNKFINNYLQLKNELYFSYSFTYDFWTIMPWINDLFVFDFLPLTYTPIYLLDLFYNSLTLGLDNNFKIRRVMNIYLSFETAFNKPFNDYFSLYLSPIIGLSGNYYFGLNWEITQYFSMDITPETKSFIFTPETYFKILYEFFRFYGPNNFRLSLMTDNSFSYSSLQEIKNSFTSGLFLYFYGVKPSLYFTLNYEKSSIERLDIGLKTGINFTKKFFSINIDYKGYKDILSNSDWINRVDFYVKFYLIKDFEAF
mgnify:CR=1 FL=1